MRHRALLLTLFASTAVLAAQNRGPLDLATAPVPAGAQRIAYGSDPQQFGELRVPATRGPHPVAIVVHGGCWLEKIPSMDARAVAIDNMRPLAAALTEAGIATWNIEYRRLGHAGGGWPGTFLDVARAADHVRTLARGHQLDLTRVIAIGHSAGGHLALWLAARPKIAKTSDLYLENPLRLTGAVDLDGPPDLKATIPLQQPVRGPVITRPDRRDRRRNGRSAIARDADRAAAARRVRRSSSAGCSRRRARRMSCEQEGGATPHNIVLRQSLRIHRSAVHRWPT